MVVHQINMNLSLLILFEIIIWIAKLTNAQRKVYYNNTGSKRSTVIAFTDKDCCYYDPTSAVNIVTVNKTLVLQFD